MSLAVAIGALVAYTNTSDVRACLPAGDGFLVGTGGGLVWTDATGAARATWTALDGLPATRIDGLSVVDGAIWVGTELGAAKLALDGSSRVRVTATFGKVATRELVAFAGTTYVATDAGVRTLAGAAIPFVGGGNKQARARVSSLAVADGALWAGTAGGLYKLVRGRFELVTIEAGANEVTSLYGDGATLWIATTAGLYTREGTRVRGYGGGDLRRVTRIDGAVVAAGVGGGIVTVDRGRLVDAKGLPRIAMATALAASVPVRDGSRDGAACAGGLDALYVRPARGAWTAVARPAAIPANDVSALAADGDTLWVGTFDHGVATLSHGQWTPITHRALDHRVNALLVEPRPGRPSRIWVATATGVSIIDGATVTQLTKADGLPARGVLSLARLRDGRILAGTMRGAAILGAGRPLTLGQKQNLDVKNVWAVAEDSHGNLWLGATNGVFRGTADDAQWTRFSVATGHLRDDWVMALAPHGDAMLVGTYKGGLTRLEPAPGESSTVTAAVTATQLGAGWINPGGLRVDGDVVYAATMEGLRTGDGTRPAWATTEAFMARDTTATARIGTRLYVATRRGIVVR